ncbi:hypothetical protein [Lactiplantibacillus plantarum]|uniref:hypothetical protein n=1 Tax=Lactiplantibacillus plantarum TaxID=1590 RepID=UPI003F52DB95
MRIDKVNLEKVIRIEKVVGNGTPEVPIKKVVQFWTTNGVLIGEKLINDLKEYEQPNC